MQKVLSILWIGLAIASCDTHRADEPAYVRIESLGLEDIDGCSWAGNSSSYITTAWITVDGDNLGAFDLPCEIPVIPKEGAQSIKITPGIDINGISAWRAQYPFYTSHEEDVVLTAGEVITLPTGGNGHVLHYGGPCLDPFMIDHFNSAGLNLSPSSLSDTNIYLITGPQKFPAPNGESNLASGEATLSPGMQRLELITSTLYDLPTGNEDVYLELDYQTSTEIVIGVIAHRPGEMTQAATATLRPKDYWHHAYINLVTEVSAYPDATSYQIFIGAVRTGEDADTTDVVRLDNLRILTCL